MTLNDVVARLHLDVRCASDRLGRDVTGGYSGDLMSDVIAHANPGEVWITMQVHVNTVAVAVLKELSGIIIVQGREPAREMLEKASAEQVPVIVTEAPAFEIAGRLYALLGGGP